MRHSGQNEVKHPSSRARRADLCPFHGGCKAAEALPKEGMRRRRICIAVLCTPMIGALERGHFGSGLKVAGFGGRGLR